MRRFLLVPALLFVLFVGCSDSQVSQVKQINADLAAGLNRATITVISYTQENIITIGEEQEILPRLADASILSDQITGCTNAVKANDTLRGCVAPLLTALNEDINAATLGIKSDGARASFGAVLKGLSNLVTQIAEVN